MTIQTKEQLAKVNELLLARARYFHHGDCVGADAEAHEIASYLGMYIIIHPPENPKSRAFCPFYKIRKEKPYLDRNHDIVNETDVLIACPDGCEEKIRSDAWATVRYARKANKLILIVYPSGRMFVEFVK